MIKEHGSKRLGGGWIPLAALALLALVAPAAAADDPLSLTFDDVSFDIKQNQPYESSMLTDKIKQYNGKTIRIKGFLAPSFKQSGLTDFVLMRNTECKFGSGDPVCHFIMVKMQGGKSIDFTVRPVSVEGEFRIDEFKIGKKVYAIYQMKGTSAE